MSISNFYRGDTQTYEITITDDESNTVDLTNSSIWFTLKSDKTLTDADAEIQRTVTTHKDAANGITEIILPSSETGSLEPDMTYFYDFQWVTSEGKVQTILAGKVKVYADITRSS